jgi:REP element-mobilizing transposase RayT
MKKFKNKYRIPSARLQNWDYGAAALYFITICTQNRVHYFGVVRDGQMQLSDIGKIVESEWLKTFTIRQDMNLWPGEHVVMPNHFHAIIGIGVNKYNTHSVAGCDKKWGTERGFVRDRDAMHRVSTSHQSASQPSHPKNQFGPQSKNLASIIRGFKSSVTIGARKINPGFQWQSRFHDHIIRNNISFQKISNYIINNPINWKEDQLFNTEQQ